MKVVVCFGDSITRGTAPLTGERYPRDIRYTGRLQKLLGDDYLVVEEGLNGRTTMLERKDMPYRNGLYYIEPCLGSHQPVDYLVLMLGSNDSLTSFNLDAKEIAKGMHKMIEVIKAYTIEHQSFVPSIILCCPPYIRENSESLPLHDDLVGSREKTIELESLYENIAKEFNLIFFNPNKYVKTSELDGIHLDENGQKIFAEEIYKIIRNN